jgi:hypothetical protein
VGGWRKKTKSCIVVEPPTHLHVEPARGTSGLPVKSEEFVGRLLKEEKNWLVLTKI